MMNKKLTAISLFSGAGGDTLGLERAGIDVIAFSEFDKKAILTHKLNFPNSILIGEKYGGDITKIPDDEFKKYKDKIDLIFAGFPCQGFSHAGKKIIDDERNQLFKEFIRVVNIVKPKYIIGENVKGLLERGNDKINFAKQINSEFEKINYKMNDPILLSLDEYGVPQKRKRVFFIGILDNRKKVILNKEKIAGIKNLIEKTLKNSIEIDISDFPYLKEAYDNKSLTFVETDESNSDNLPHPFLKRKIESKEISFGVRKSPYHVEVLNLNNPSKTISSSYSFQPRQFILLKNHENKFFIRELTVKELQQIQGFPYSFIFKESKNDAIKQIGNAVPPLIVEKIVKQIII